jgi:hypothetical protein
MMKVLEISSHPLLQIFVKVYLIFQSEVMFLMLEIVSVKNILNGDFMIVISADQIV